MSKGVKVSKINRGSGVLIVLRSSWRRGSVREGRVQVRGGVRRPHALPSCVRGARAAASSSGFVLLLARDASRGTARHPGPSAVSRVWNSSLNAPFLDPRGHQRACTGKRPVSRGEAHSAYNSGGDEAPFTSGVPHYTPPDLAVFSAPPLSHTHSRREPGEGRRLRDGEMLIIRGRQPTRHNIFFSHITQHSIQKCLVFFNAKSHWRLAICTTLLYHKQLGLFSLLTAIFGALPTNCKIC